MLCGFLVIRSIYASSTAERSFRLVTRQLRPTGYGTLVVRCTGKGLQELDKVALILIAQPEAEAAVVMIHDVEQRGETAIVVKATLGMGPQSGEWRGAIAPVR